MAKTHYIPVTADVPGASNEQNRALIRKAVQAVLAAEGVDRPCEVDVLLTDDKGIQAINRDMRNVDRPTDVLSFPALVLTPGTPPTAEDTDPGSGLVPLGDVAVSMERVSAQAKEYNHSKRRELSYLVVHSVLHLLGYDHMDEGPMKAQMRARENVVLENLGISRETQRQVKVEDHLNMTEIKKSGIITIVGRPNVGKSTLTNTLAGEKVAIVSPKPQTTRNRICAVLNRGNSQFVFMDTPGLHRARTRLGDYMVKIVRQSVADVDGVVLMVEPVDRIGSIEKELVGKIKSLGIPAALAVNKIDTVEKEKLLSVIASYADLHDWDAVVPISAKTGEGVEELLDVLDGWLPEGPQLFPDGVVTDQPERQVMAELVREKILWNLEKEVPHGVAVEITKFSQRDNGIIDCHATIYCEKESHKGIIIGKNGAMLKKISTQAREDMERFMGAKVYLETWVKVKENWRDNPSAIQSFGYTDE